MHVTVTTTVGGRDQPDDAARLVGEEMRPWLDGLEGFHGILVLSGTPDDRTLVVTFWESKELADRHLAVRADFRERIAATVGVVVEDVSDFALVFADLGALRPGPAA